ncbi:MAG: hypothetical protein IJ496_10890 [Ruminococcus sp.]|nr:hypothetical protein [Ruminococcus sp.]
MTKAKRKMIWGILALILMGLIIFGAVSLREYTYWTRLNGMETEEFSITEDEERTEAEIMQWPT